MAKYHPGRIMIPNGIKCGVCGEMFASAKIREDGFLVCRECWNKDQARQELPHEWDAKICDQCAGCEKQGLACAGQAGIFFPEDCPENEEHYIGKGRWE